MNRNLILLPFLVFLCFAFSSCIKESRPLTANGTISGDVSYRERIALPEGATLKLKLVDTGKTPSQPIAETSQTLTATPPYTFQFTYSPDLVSDQNQYVLQAAIRVDGELRFSGSQPVELFAVKPEPVKIMAKASAIIRSVEPLVDLENIYWKLQTIGTMEVKKAKNQPQETFMQLTSKKHSARGFAGCNIFSGSYETAGNKLTFGPTISTMKACADTMENEQQFLAALAETAYFAINGKTLSLYSIDKNRRATFQAK